MNHKERPYFRNLRNSKMPNANTTLTMYFCGSGNNMCEYKANKHAVPHLIHLAKGRHIGFDGPGGNDKGHDFFVRNNDGSFVKDMNGNKLYTGKKKVKAGKLNKNSKTGHGTNKTFEKAMDWLMNRFSDFHSNPVIDINLCGHSRGSVTATAVAWAINYFIKPEFPKIRVNMFLFDPVAGIKNEFNKLNSYDGEGFPIDIDKLPKVVQKFRGLYAANMIGSLGVMSKDKGFQSTMPTQNGCPDYDVYVMPGGHNGATKYNLQDGGSQIGRIGLHMAQKFLIDNGSTFSGDCRITPEDVLEGYAMARNPKRGARAQVKSFSKLNEDLQFFSDDNQVQTTSHRQGTISSFSTFFGDRFFVNDHHAEVFTQRFPMIAAKVKIGKVHLNDITRLQMPCPETALLIRSLGMVKHQGTN